MNKIYHIKKKCEMKRVDRRVKKAKSKEINEVLKERLEKFKNYDFVVEGAVLDAGTGVGVDLLALSFLTKNTEFVGVDISKGALKVARKILFGLKTFHLIRADIEYLPFRDNIFNGVNLSYVLHHHPMMVLRTVMSDLKRIMKNGAKILIKEPSSLLEKEALYKELSDFRHGINDFKEILRFSPSRGLRKHFYNVLPIFQYGTGYPSLFKKMVADAGLKIVIFEVKQDSPRKLRYKKLLREIEAEIQKSRLTPDEKMYLRENLQALQEKIALIGLAEGESFLILKALKA